MSNDKYYVDKRNGCIGVRECVDYQISNWLHPDLPDVVAFWDGNRLTNGDKRFEWTVEAWACDKAYDLCELLNRLSSTSV